VLDHGALVQWLNMPMAIAPGSKFNTFDADTNNTNTNTNTTINTTINYLYHNDHDHDHTTTIAQFYTINTIAIAYIDVID
jgi:hypothetical protein